MRSLTECKKTHAFCFQYVFQIVAKSAVCEMERKLEFKIFFSVVVCSFIGTLKKQPKYGPKVVHNLDSKYQCEIFMWLSCILVLNYGSQFLCGRNLIIDANYSSGKCGTISIRINHLEIWVIF